VTIESRNPPADDVAHRRPKLAFLTNVVAPYRVALMEHLGRVFETTILYSGDEPNRKEWKALDGRATDGVRVKKSWGIMLSLTRKRDGGSFDHRFVHFTPGYVVDLLKIRPDAIVSAELGFRTVVALAYAKLTRVSLWVLWGGTRHTEAELGVIKRLFRSMVVPLVPRWLSYGTTSTEYLLDVGVREERILQMQNCVDETVYRSPRHPYLNLQPRPVLLCAGRLVPGKGVDLLLEIVASLQEEGLQFSLLIVGTGVDAPRLVAKVQSLNLKNTLLIGAVEPSKMPSVYRSADLVVFPTLADVWGLVINEALWSGIPVLGSGYAGASRELLAPEHVFDPLDRADFLAKLRSAIRTGLGPVDTSRLLKMDAVADLIASDILRRVSGLLEY